MSNKFKTIDTEAFVKYFGGIDQKTAVNIYVKTGNIFLKNIESRIQALTDSLTNYDNQNAIITAHQVKGSLLSLGGNELADLFRQIEMSVNLSPNTDLIVILGNLKPALEIFKAELQVWIKELEATIV